MTARTPSSPARLKHFLREKLYYFLLAAITLALLLLFLFALRASPEAIIVTTFFFASFVIIVLVVEYWRRRNFYRKLLSNIASLDRAYLVLETLNCPSFYDGRILYDALYAINKSMAETVQRYELDAHEFREYIEMWIHEVKTPLATLSLVTKDRKIAAQINRLDSYVEQVLYFARAENAERDYLIKPVSLAKVIAAVATRNQDLLLASQIDLSVGPLDYSVYTDSKWLEFILNQIIQNSIKYQSTAIKISAAVTDDITTLIIADDGIGISAKDLPRVFEKSFTGENGHAPSTTKPTSPLRKPAPASSGQKSTGMGLYIVKTLCDKLGHQISIASPARRGTTVTLTFPHHDYYQVLHKTGTSPAKNRVPARKNHTPSPKNRVPAKNNHTSAPEKHDLSKK